MRSFTSRSPIFNLIVINRVAPQNVPKNAIFYTFQIWTHSAFVVSKIGEREKNLRMILHKFRIHHFVRRSIAET